jgi:hypothetical protein
LKTKAFISQKSLDTPVFGLIRFLQKVLTALPPLELFSLEEEAAQLPGGLFVYADVSREQFSWNNAEQDDSDNK